MQKSAMISALILVCGCGGGGGGGSSSQFPGVYEGQLVATANTCTFQLSPTDVTYTVNQDGSRVVLDSKSGRVYEGTVTDADSFVVSRTGTETCVDQHGNPIPSSTAQFTATITFRFSNDDTAHVVFHEDDGNCSGNTFHNSTCSFEREGTLTRKLDA